MVYDRDKIGSAISFSFGDLVRKEWNPQMKACNKKMVKVRVGQKERRDGVKA